MADAKPVRIGVAKPKGKPRNTARPVRQGLVQLKNTDGTPADEAGTPASPAPEKVVAKKKAEKAE
jgi:hypothetical protein